MKIEVLLSTMNQENYDILHRCNIKTYSVVINQCGQESVKQIDNGTTIWVDSSTKGLSRSRNLAISFSRGDICLLCDDDVVYYDDYEKTIANAFNMVKKADVLVFDIDEENVEKPRKKIKRIKKIPAFRTYGSVHIAFKKSSFVDKKISFDERFGSGSGKYSMAEDALLFREFKKKKLKVYLFPATISKVNFDKSSWFSGYNEKFFFDEGAFLVTAYPTLYIFLKWYFPFRLFKKTTLHFFEIIRWINRGISGCKNGKSFSDLYGDNI